MHIWRTASRTGHPFLSEADLDGQERLTREYHLPTAEVLVAEDREEIVGFLAHVGDQVGALFVAPEAQRRGVGRSLLQAIQDQRHVLELQVYEANEAARAFYADMGFKPVGRQEDDQEGRPLPILRLAWSR